MLKKWLTCLLALLLSFSLAQACADEIIIEEIATQIGDNCVAYPQLSGMKDTSVQQKINDDIVMSSGVTNHIVTLATLMGSQQTLRVDYQAALLEDDIFSVVISAKGKLPGKRDGHSWTAMTYDLHTGEKLTLEDLFTDADAAVAHMEQIAEETLSDELNGYMEYSDILPLPVDSFTLDENGITFWYPAEQFSLLSGYSGACQFWYQELDGLWLKSPVQQLADTEMKKAISASVAEGRLPHVPVQMGESMQQVMQQYRLLRTPDEFPGGRYFVLEDPAFRQTLVISDALSADFAQSLVEGIQLRRGGLYGLLIGKTTQQRWREVLGQPDANVAFSENMAYDYDLPAGQYDVYHYGENQLRLHADENGVLCALQLCK